MPNYKETTDTANAWRRCFRVVIDNPMTAPPSARFFEEDVVTMPTMTMRSEAGAAMAVFDAGMVIPLRDPATGELTGAYTTQGNLYQELYSLYMQTALERDAAG